MEPRVPWSELALCFTKLGCSSFGGPVAHLGYFRATFVEERGWLDDAEFADLVALCQFLPGPASSQVVFALGMKERGLGGALLASACFTLPSALLMLAFASGVGLAQGLEGARWIHGLKLAAVAVVAQAVWSMGQKLCPDRARLSLCLGAAACVLAVPGAFAQVMVLSLGGLAGYWLFRREVPELVEAQALRRAPGRLGGTGALLAFALLLVTLPFAAAVSGARWVELVDSFYRSGALVFGGGHVVLPLLREELVPTGLLSDQKFLAGYGAAQALPGPLFAFSAYLGAAMNPGAGAWQTALLCLGAIFLPGWLLVAGALPFWERLRGERGIRAALWGTNAVVVGVLLAALYDPVFVESVRSGWDMVVVLAAFGALEIWRVSPVLVVFGAALVG